MLNVTRFLQRLGGIAYARCFKVDAEHVQVAIHPPPRIDISAAGDVKDLIESGVFKEFDKSKLRARYNMHY